MLDIDKCGQAASLLRLRDHRECECGLSRSFWPENFNYSPARKSTDAKRPIDENVARWNDIDIGDLPVTEPHDGAFAIILGDLLNRQIEILVPRGNDFVFTRLLYSFSGHIWMPLSKSGSIDSPSRKAPDRFA